MMHETAPGSGSDEATSERKAEEKKEFINYIKSSGASAALQNAMILLHRMPIKPENLLEYIYEFFDNKAPQLQRISLLKAELCYKKDELEKYTSKVKATENRIEELISTMGICEKEFETRFIPKKIMQSNRLSILQRYFKNMEREDAPKNAEMFQDPVNSLSNKNVLPKSKENFELDTNDCNGENGSLPNGPCVDATNNQDIKNADASFNEEESLLISEDDPNIFPKVTKKKKMKSLMTMGHP